MPNELNIALATTGLTVTCQRYQAGAAVGSAISCPETGSTGFYSGNMAGAAGTYQLAFLAAGANVGGGSIIWDGTNEIATSTLTAAQVNAEADTALADVGLTSTVTGRIDAAISSRLAPNGTLATVTTLTNAPSVPSAASIRAEIDSNSTQLAAIKSKTDNLPASPAATSDIPTANITAIKAKTDALPASPAATGDIPSANIAAIKAKTDNLPASPAATGDIPSANIAAIKAKTDNLPASPAATGDIPSANITAIKAKTDLLNTDRLAQCSTVSTTGAQLAAALS